MFLIPLKGSGEFTNSKCSVYADIWFTSGVIIVTPEYPVGSVVLLEVKLLSSQFGFLYRTYRL